MTENTTRLGRDVFMALAAVGWADGKYHQDEADALVRTALEEGLDVEEIAELEEQIKSPVEMGQIDLTKLTKEDRLFIYAVAAWMSRIDGEADSSEAAALSKLGELLKIPEKPRMHADAIAREVAALPEGDSPARFDLPRVRKLIGERLAEARKLRAEAKDEDKK
ncbi:MAG TPA: hypothetical protein PLI95_03555 [Polyangiaceae bacterium]|nr:hypothetical protein [Polyangiaceae bacterium]